GPPPPPPPPPPGPPQPQWGWQQKPVQLHPNGNWRKCLEVRGSWFQNGTPVDIFECNGSPGQNWVLNPGSTKVQVAGQPFCLDAGEWPNDGTQLKIWNCYDGLPAQQWFYTDDKRVALKDSGKCVDLTNGDTCNGNILQLWQCLNFDTNQIWNS
ncbi:carbohydrate-binding module family 13 protein, partial [Coprinopsis sp. MPI-PUGE-AT-0042]